MSDLYKGDGCLVVTSVARLSGGKPAVEAHVVAVKDPLEAQEIVKKHILPGETITHVERLSPGVMETFGLFPNRTTKMGVING